MKTRYILSLAGVAIATALFFRPLAAQQVATDILDDVVVDRVDYNAIIKVVFKRPFRYISHSPTRTGNTINVRIDILDSNRSTADQLIDNESIPVSDDKGTGLSEVVYEKNGRNSKYILFYFNHDVSFEVLQGTDQRSLSIIIYGLE
jgi:hypothetical protein